MTAASQMGPGVPPSPVPEVEGEPTSPGSGGGGGRRFRRLKPIRRLLRYHLARAAIGLLAVVPVPVAHVVFGGLGAVAYPLMRGQRRLVLAQITHARPHWTENARTRLARRVFVEMGRNAASVARLARRDPSQALGNLRKSGPGRIEDLAGGAVVVSAHLGPWELGPTALARLGVPVWVVVRPVREARLDRLVTRLRTAHGPRLLPRDADARRVRRLLREGAVVVVAADQRPRGRRVAGTFLGRPAWIPTGPALLARAADVPIVPMVVRRSGPGRHELRVGRPIPLDRRMPRPEAVMAAARAASGALEGFVEDDLEQWGSWFHERWKEVPRPCPSDSS